MFDLCEMGLTEEEAAELEYYYNVDEPDEAITQIIFTLMFTQVLDMHCPLTQVNCDAIL